MTDEDRAQRTANTRRLSRRVMMADDSSDDNLDEDEDSFVSEPEGTPLNIRSLSPLAFLSLGVGSDRLIRHMVSLPLNVSLRCFPVAMMPGHERHDVENGGKIILPPSILQHLTRSNVSYPMLFRLTNKASGRTSHCGVLEFIADVNKCYVPLWMMKNLHLHPGDMVQIQSATLPVAQFAKFEPQSVDFLDITNPKAMLENALRNWNCLSTGDIIAVMYNGKIYELRILETRPDSAVSIMECDMDVDFAPPVGYVEPDRPNPEATLEENTLPSLPENTFLPFTGTGNRLDGKVTTQDPAQPNVNVTRRRGVPAYEYTSGSLQFPRNFQYYINKKALAEQKDDHSFVPFSGIGFTLRSRNMLPS